MKLCELPCNLLRLLASRCQDYDVVHGDNRIICKAVSSICLAEIDRRVEGKDFPELSDDVATMLHAQITTTGPAEFARLVFELEE